MFTTSWELSTWSKDWLDRCFTNASGDIHRDRDIWLFLVRWPAKSYYCTSIIAGNYRFSVRYRELLKRPTSRSSGQQTASRLGLGGRKLGWKGMTTYQAEWCFWFWYARQKSGKYEPTFSKLRDRAEEARCWLKMRPEKEIAVVTHGSFLHFLTNDWEDSNIYEGMALK